VKKKPKTLKQAVREGLAHPVKPRTFKQAIRDVMNRMEYYPSGIRKPAKHWKKPSQQKA